MGRLRYQAAPGVRAAVLELRPGLYVVAEVPEDKFQGDDFGFVPLLAPMVVSAARHAIDHPPGERRRERRQALALPGPVAPEWVDEEVAEAFGCAACDGACGRGGRS